MLDNNYIAKFKEILNTAIYLEQNEYCLYLLLKIEDNDLINYYQHDNLTLIFVKCQNYTSNNDCYHLYQRLINGIRVESIISVKLN